LTEQAGPHDWKNFQLGEYVADKFSNGRIVVDIDAGTSLPPYKAEEWKHYGKGVIMKSRRYGLIHFEDRRTLEPSNSLEVPFRWARMGCLVICVVALSALALFVNPWGGIRHGKDWTCPPVPAKVQLCTRGVPTPTP